MAAFVGHPAFLFVVLVALFVAAVAFGAYILRRIAPLPEDDREDFNLVQTATLTLLALLVGFSLSMAVGRYDQRKNLEESEANAIGTEYARADLVSAAVGAKMKAGLVRYTELRLADFRTRDRQELERIHRDTAALQSELWQLATQVAQEQPTPIGALVVAGMNDVLNSQDYTQAARINRIPLGAWILMIVIALCGCVVQGYGTKGKLRRGLLITILPVTVALSLALIADIDSPRAGFIRVQPLDLTRLLQSLTK
jgi:signal transduction histidine kinase